MSVLETPRVYFRGQVTWDPIVTNNYPNIYDEVTAEPLPDGVSADVFRSQAIADVTSGNWNPHGSHRSAFFDTFVSGVDTGDGLCLHEGFVGSPVSFLGMLVDCEPYGAFSSQLFFDSMQFGVDGGCRIACQRSTRFIARYINFTRNSHNRMIAGIASVVWQTSFAKAGLQFDPHDSRAIAMLATALESDDVLGLTVRWNAYRTVYFGDACLRNGTPATRAAATALQAKLIDGGWQPNPARSLLVGVLGLWRRGEPAQEPGDRTLLAATTAQTAATAHARLSHHALTIDLSNSIAEVNGLLSKQNFGPVDIIATNSEGSKKLATLSYPQYDRSAYEATSGLVTIPLDEASLEAATVSDLELLAGDGTVLLSEAGLRAVPLTHNVYIDEGQSAQLSVQVLKGGMPVGHGVAVSMYDAQPDTPVLAAETVTDEQGVARFDVASIQGGAVNPYIFVPGVNPPLPQGIDPQLTTYTYVRTLPANSAMATLPPTWDNVYKSVLVKWHAMAPCMDNWLRLGDEAQIRKYGSLLRRLTDPANFESYMFMPVVRDMTAGERILLYKFLDTAPEALVSEDMSPAVRTMEAKMPESATIPTSAIRNIAALSRAMRSG
ncbi:MAG: hypothetical protein IPK66_16025 [Rhodospirillales bacterium]|nr:hypothetical protein [Rhodospirillales bacterium]